MESSLSKSATLFANIDKMAKMADVASKMATIAESAVKFSNMYSKSSELANSNPLLQKILSNTNIIASTHVLNKPLNLVFPNTEFSKYTTIAKNVEVSKHVSNILSIEERNKLVHSKRIVESLSFLDTVSAIAKKENEEKKKLHSLLGNWINDVNSFGHICSPTMDDPCSVSYYNKIESQIAFSLDIDIHTLSQQAYYEHLSMFLKNDNEIKENDRLISIVKAVKSFLNSCLKRFQINKREFIRKMNSFFFKNLDDCHSITLVSIGY